MVIVFLSDCYNHHQSSFSQAMYRLLDGNYYFVATKPVGAERRRMGWKEEYPPFVKRWYIDDVSAKECEKLIDECDVVITGSAPEILLKKRMEQHKMIIRYSERIYKKSFEWYKWPVRLFRYAKKHNRRNMFLLCSSAYTAMDFALTGNYIGKTYKWGYFPPTKLYEDIDSLMRGKNTHSILWVSRYLDWKHPELPIYVAERLKQDGCDFTMTMIGNGMMEAEIGELIQQKKLQDHVHQLGSMSQDEVRHHMEQAGIFLFTSDFNEGWGAVLNESMNSGCAVVASHAIGSVPYLIDHEQNGLIYENGNPDDLYLKVKRLLNSPTEQYRLGTAAYRKITQLWNAEVGAQRILMLIQQLQQTGRCDMFEEGPCSRAKNLRNGWFRER